MVRLHITFLHFTARNRCGAYNPVTPDIIILVSKNKNNCRVGLTWGKAKSTPDLFHFVFMIIRGG